jgi:hypothetical protein
MGEMIQKPDANPILLGALNFLILGGLGYFLMGQKKKAITSWIAVVLLYTVGWLCIIGPFIGFVLILATSYDAYLLGQKLQAGESIGENENAIEFLNKIFKD